MRASACVVAIFCLLHTSLSAKPIDPKKLQGLQSKAALKIPTRQLEKEEKEKNEKEKKEKEEKEKKEKEKKRRKSHGLLEPFLHNMDRI